MKLKEMFAAKIGALSFRILTSFPPKQTVFAHCDTLDGPVVMAARKALETNNANYILIWVKPESEVEIAKIFKRAIAAKQLAKTDAEKLASETELFEALVRIHREGEGARYEGLKPAGSVELEITMADKAVETGKLDDILHHIQSPSDGEIIRHLFREVKERSQYDKDNVPAGREFVRSYVIFIHAVEKAIKGMPLAEGETHDH